MNEEAGFIAALLAEPDDRTTLLVYADWLDERNDPRGEYLRLLAKKRPNKTRLRTLQRRLDSAWVQAVASRGFEVNSLVRILTGSCRGLMGKIAQIAKDRATASVFPLLFGRPILVELPFTSLERLENVAAE